MTDINKLAEEIARATLPVGAEEMAVSIRVNALLPILARHIPEQNETPVAMVLHCPDCRSRHIDVHEFATKPHHTHACQNCGMVWRPAIGPTVGVQFLPGFKNAAQPIAQEKGMEICPACRATYKIITPAGAHCVNSWHFQPPVARPSAEADPLRCAERSRTSGMQCIYNKRHGIPHEFERAEQTPAESNASPSAETKEE